MKLLQSVALPLTLSHREHSPTGHRATFVPLWVSRSVGVYDGGPLRAGAVTSVRSFSFGMDPW